MLAFSVLLLLFAQASTESRAEDGALAELAAKARAAMNSGQYGAAESHYRGILKLQPGMAEAYMNLGLSCYLQKKYTEAADAFLSGLKLKPSMSNAQLFLGLSQFHMNRPAAAAKSLERFVAQRPDDFQGVYHLGLSYLAMDEYELAEKSLRAAQRADPKSIDAHYHLAQVYLGKARKDAASANRLLPFYERAVESIAEIDHNSFRLAQLRAGLYEVTGKRAEAIAELETLLRNDPKVRGLHYALGCLYLDTSQYEKAAEQFLLEMKLDSPYPRTYLQLGHVYVAMNRPQEALPLLQEAAAIDPSDRALIWVDIGRAHRSLNQHREATAAFQKAIEFGKQDSTVYYQLANSARRAGLNDVAQRAMEESVRLKATESGSSPAPK